MPRFENTDNAGSTAIRDYCRTSGNGSSTFDVCHRCAEDVRGLTPAEAGFSLNDRHEPQGFLDGAVEHPDYEDDEYLCAVCGKTLTSRNA